MARLVFYDGYDTELLSKLDFRSPVFSQLDGCEGTLRGVESFLNEKESDYSEVLKLVSDKIDDCNRWIKDLENKKQREKTAKEDALRPSIPIQVQRYDASTCTYHTETQYVPNMCLADQIQDKINEIEALENEIEKVENGLEEYSKKLEAITSGLRSAIYSLQNYFINFSRIKDDIENGFSKVREVISKSSKAARKYMGTTFHKTEKCVIDLIRK